MLGQNRYAIRTIRFESGERFPVLVDPTENALVHIPLARYALSLRGRRLAARTIEKHLRDVGSVLNWELARNESPIDFEYRLQSGTGFSDGEVRHLVQHLRVKHTKSPDNAEQESVSGPTLASRLCNVAAYATFIAREAQHRADEKSYDRINSALTHLLRCLQDATPIGKPGEGRGLTRKLRERLEMILEPHSKLSPWTSAVSCRNLCVVSLFLDTGLRLSELARVKLEDVVLIGADPTIDVRTNRDDPDDPRADLPEAKTRGRRLPLSPRLGSSIWRYISHERARTPHAKTSPFLFVTEAGKPMSRRAIQNVVERLSVKYPEFSGRLTCHVLRHTFNSDLRKALRESGHSRDRVEEVQAYACGWSLKSQMPRHYSRHEIESSAHEAMMRLHKAGDH